MALGAAGYSVALAEWVPFAWHGSDWVMQKVARDCRQAGVWMQSTLVLYESGMARRPGYRMEEQLLDPAFACLPEPMRRAWAGIGEFMPDWMTVLWRRHPEFTRRLAGVLHRAGVPFMAGTDALGAPFAFPGTSLHRELYLLVESGFSSQEALWTATAGPALFLGRESEFGTISVGQRADLLLVDGNPLEDLRRLREPRGVMVRGIWLPRTRLDEMLRSLVQASDVDAPRDSG
jgi:hypothetical protein